MQEKTKLLSNSQSSLKSWKGLLPYNINHSMRCKIILIKLKVWHIVYTYFPEMAIAFYKDVLHKRSSCKTIHACSDHHIYLLHSCTKRWQNSGPILIPPSKGGIAQENLMAKTMHVLIIVYLLHSRREAGKTLVQIRNPPHARVENLAAINVNPSMRCKTNLMQAWI